MVTMNHNEFDWQFEQEELELLDDSEQLRKMIENNEKAIK
jgi:hypothetical protein